MEKNIDIYNKKEECNIKTKIFYNKNDSIKTRIFIFCHGYCSGKGSNSIKIVANKLLEHNIPSISFDFPGHIDSVQGTDKLKVDVCISYIDSVIDYIKKQYGKNIKISFFAISFGAYILLNKLITDNDEYDNIILRSPAFNMKDIFINCLLKEEFEDYKKNGKAKTGHDGKIIVPYSFYEDLIEHDLYVKYKEKRKILIIQGDLDDTSIITDTYKFIANRSEFELIEMKNVKHHMEPNEISASAKIMLKNMETSNVNSFEKCPEIF